MSVYFVSDGKYIKIGYTAYDNPTRRFKSLQTSCSANLALLGFIPNATTEVEREYHNRFSRNRVRGEWFESCDEIIEEASKYKWINDINNEKPFISEIGKILCTNIRQERIRAGFTQAGLAKAIEMSAGYIGEVEVGKKIPHLDSVEKIADACGVPMYLFYMSDTDKKELSSKCQSFSNSYEMQITKKMAIEICNVISRYGIDSNTCQREEP